MSYGSHIVEVVSSSSFDAWLAGLKDRVGRAKILARIDRLSAGNPGDVRPVGDGISEMRIDFGPGYRVYFRQMGRVLVILLAGGDKSTQAGDIKRARDILKDWSG